MIYLTGQRRRKDENENEPKTVGGEVKMKGTP